MLTEKLKGDFAAYCDQRALAAQSQADHHAAVYGNDLPGSSAMARAAFEEKRKLLSEGEAKADRWRGRAVTARKGLLRMDASDIGDPEYTLDKVVQQYRGEALKAGLISYG